MNPKPKTELAAATDAATLDPLVLPDDLSGLSDDELEAAVSECQERSELLNDDDTLKGLDNADAVALITNAVDTGEALDSECQKREDARAEAEQILAETRERLQKRLNPEADADEADADEADADEDADEEPTADADTEDTEDAEDTASVVVKVAEPVAAARKRNPAIRRKREHEPTTASHDGPKLLALADMPGSFQAGTEITRKQAAELVSDRWNKSHAVDGPRQDVPLIRFAIDTPDDRMMVDGDDVGNWEKLQRVVGDEALVASGGICAPPEPYYDLQILAGAQTPVVDSIPRFGSGARGGISWMTPPTLADITTGVGQITAAADKLGGTNATKTCQTLPCPATQTAFIDAIYHCLTIGTIGARTWPEFVQHFTKLTAAAHARVRETKALDALKAGSTQVTQAAVGGAAPTLLGGVLQAAEAMRNRHRMPDTAVLRAWFPAWALGLLAEDFIRRPYDKMEALDSGYKAFVTAKLRACQIAPTFYVDSETAGGMVFPAQAAAALTPFPATCKWFIAPEGTWVRLDGGTLDLGIVRDSVLNATNDFQMFGEVFETYAKIGIESLEITTTMAATGVVTAPA